MSTDHIAQHDAENLIGRHADQFTAEYERYENRHGVPVRRLVLRGVEQVDPTAVKAGR